MNPIRDAKSIDPALESATQFAQATGGEVILLLRGRRSMRLWYKSSRMYLNEDR